MGGWRDGSVVKSTCSRGPGFKSIWRLITICNSSPKGSKPSKAAGTWLAHRHRRVCAGKAPVHIKREAEGREVCTCIFSLFLSRISECCLLRLAVHLQELGCLIQQRTGEVWEGRVQIRPETLYFRTGYNSLRSTITLRGCISYRPWVIFAVVVAPLGSSALRGLRNKGPRKPNPTSLKLR